MNRFRTALALLGFGFAAAGCDSAPEGTPVDAGRGAAATAGAVSPQLSVPAVPQTSKWALDPENSSVQFVSKHVLTKVRGMLPKPSGTVVLDEGTPANSK